MDREIAAVQAYFDFLGENDRYEAALKAFEQQQKSGVRLLTVEVVLKGKEPVLPFKDKLVVEVDYPAWYKVNAINYGARHLINEGYKFIAWFDADSYVEPENWKEQAVSLLKNHNFIQLGERLYCPGEEIEESTTIACELNSSSSPKTRGFDGGGWAATAEFFTDLGLWPYSMVEGGNKILLYPFMKKWLKDHPLLIAVEGTEMGEELKQYFNKLEKWNNGRPIGYLKGYNLHLLPHGSAAGRKAVWAIRYAFYRNISIENDIQMRADGFPVVSNKQLRNYLELILKERSFPSEAG